jgi:NitT/TauT family transport system permease protein
MVDAYGLRSPARIAHATDTPGSSTADRAKWRAGWLRLRRILLPTLLGVIILGAWQLSVTRGGISPILLPLPEQVLSTMWSNLPLLREHGLHSAGEAVLALAISASLGLVLALAISRSRLVRAALYPNLLVFELVPKIALAPLFIIWIGTGADSRLTFATFLAFFPVLVATLAGLVATDPMLIRLCQSLDASRWQIFSQVRFPYALPYFFSGLKIASVMATIGIIVGEFITGNRGLGYITMFAASNMESSLMLAAICLLCLVGVLLYGFVALLENLVNRRYGRPRA